jgi:SAM-dependent methyltransferase
MRCPECHLVWLNPRPCPTDVGRLYEDYYTHNAANDLGLSRLHCLVRDSIITARLGYEDQAAGALQLMLGRVLSRIAPLRELAELSVMALRKVPQGRLLEIGCGNGFFLAKMRDLGWDVVGVEPDAQAARIGRNRPGITVLEGSLDDTDFPDDEFDAIAMHHVIEHVWDPIHTLRQCRRVLKPKGTLAIVTPNVESWGHRMFGGDWFSLEPPRHLYLFSASTLRLCAEQAGLDVTRAWSSARRARTVYPYSRMIRQQGRLVDGLTTEGGWPLRLGSWVFQAVEHGLCLIAEVGEELVLIATK